LEKGCVEIRWRRDGKTEDVPLGHAAEKIRGLLTAQIEP
jgi:hypothetical protein